VESSGPHSNGYSLIRSILKKHKAPESIMKVLLKPTHLYPAPVLELIKKTNVKGMAHITGGGLTENIPRILRSGLVANVNLSSWKFPKAFKWLQDKGKISESDMLRIFNCGIGMVCILDKAEVSKAKKILSAHKLQAFEIGSIIKGDLKERIQYN
jgi:phosphoribosylformylglycinamidine cyclo-ligase